MPLFSVACTVLLGINLCGASDPSLSDRYRYVLDRLAGHGLAGQEVAIVLDPKDFHHWKAAIRDPKFGDTMIPVAEEVDTPLHTGFRMLKSHPFFLKRMGDHAHRTDLKATSFLIAGLRNSTNLTSDLTFRLISRTSHGLDIQRALVENIPMDWSDGVFVSIGSPGYQGNEFRFNEEGQIVWRPQSCLGSPHFPPFDTPNFPAR